METFDCKYYLRCGMCELKKTECTYFKPLDTPPIYKPFNPNENISVTVYGCPPANITTQYQYGCPQDGVTTVSSTKVPGVNGITYTNQGSIDSLLNKIYGQTCRAGDESTVDM